MDRRQALVSLAALGAVVAAPATALAAAAPPAATGGACAICGVGVPRAPEDIERRRATYALVPWCVACVRTFAPAFVANATNVVHMMDCADKRGSYGFGPTLTRDLLEALRGGPEAMFIRGFPIGRCRSVKECANTHRFVAAAVRARGLTVLG